MSTAMKYDRLVNALPRLRPAHHDPAQPKYELHPLAEIFPPPSKVDLFQLAEDIRRAGGSAPILKSGDKIIDDRGRFEACKIAKVRIEFREWDGSDSLATTIARLNLPRVHLTESQRAAIAVPWPTRFPPRIRRIGRPDFSRRSGSHKILKKPRLQRILPSP